MLLQVVDKFFHQQDRIGFFHFGELLVVNNSLPKEGIGAGLAGVDLDSSFQTNAVTSLT